MIPSGRIDLQHRIQALKNFGPCIKFYFYVGFFVIPLDYPECLVLQYVQDQHLNSISFDLLDYPDVIN